MRNSLGLGRPLGIATLALLLSGGLAVAQQGHNVTVAMHTDIANADVCMNQSNDIGPVIRQNVVENLTELDPNSDVQPLLATSWEMIDEDTWRFQLREGVKFHDGADFNADSVVTAVKRLQNPALGCLDASKMTFTVEAEKVDDLTVDLTANPPQLLMPIFASVIAVGSPNTPFDEVSRSPVGTGPFRFANWDANGITLERFDGYWGEQPEVEKATYVYRGESALRAAMVEVGEADIALGIAFQDATNPDTDKGFLNLETTRIRLAGGAPFDDIRVRKALNLAVDREAFIGTLLPEQAQIASQVVVSSVAGYNPNIEPWPYDPEEAKRLIEEAKAAGVPVDKPITFIGKTDWWANNREVLQTIVQGWNDQLGTNIQIAWGDFPQWIAVAIDAPDRWNRDALMIEHLHDNIFGDASFSLPFLYQGTGPQSDLRDPEIDALLDKAGNTPSGPDRDALYQEAFQKITDLAPDVMLYHMASFVRVSPRINFAPSPFTNEVKLSNITFNN